ncbi:tetratricopeptide-like helical domain-containing protein [Cavenderia fasciculata]|uniref:Tetratricopeptide-like helical domain-containing protein n=1 Tax=Cavenderia fasciculata TaxID=261658 RepID=F4PQF9_CACFS|nr:tetratricopeptide-like helical domain-containing protein [Cavenderia fasciculata]EGG22622.1 tetratricopeptide-like helical domain-containing protein [Cavenderia fasciculata]|eukprot:XP_004360473.1 tetratricopeptide-like helical domain-containing protein [Cavenderia fasciculata]
MNSFTSVNVIDKIQQKIECIDTWEFRGVKRLLLGTYEGYVLIYEVTERPNVSIKLVDTKQLSRKPIQQMTVLEPYNMLVILTDGDLKVFDLVNGFSQRTPLTKAKGCNVYAVAQNGSSLSLCAAVKKKLMLYNWDGTDFLESKEFNIPDITKALDYRGDSIVVCFKKAYNIINTIDGSVHNVDTEKISFATFFQNNEFLIVKNNMSFFINTDAVPTRKYALTWSDSPTNLTIYYPFVLSIEARQVEIQIVPESKTNSKAISQTLFINGGKAITSKKDIYVASNSTVWRLVQVPILELVDQLVTNSEFETAINVLTNSPDTLPGKRDKLSKIKISAAYHQFSREQYISAMELFLSASFDPLKVISLFPGFLPQLLQEKLSVPIQTKDLEKNEDALGALDAFLVSIRKELQKPDRPPYNLNPPELHNSGYDLPTLIDTTLLKVYIKLKPNLISVFFNLKNSLHIEETQRVLIEEKKFTELVTFYQSKAMHREALSLLVKNSGPKETIAYLCTLGKQHITIILEQSKWVLQSCPDEALLIFTTERKEKDELPPDQVIPHISAHARSLLMEYLECIINNPIHPDKTPDFHNALIFEYLTKINTFIRHSPAPRAQETPAASELGNLREIRLKLINFLQTSKFYLPEKMLSRFPVDDLFEERAILLSKIGRHEQALAIYAHKLKNFKMAEEYCDRVYNRDSQDSRDVYLNLLNVYLKPEGTDSKPLIGPALALLNKHYRSINTPNALGLLPLETSIKELYPFFESVIRDNTKTKRDNQVIKNLFKAENVKIKEELIHLRSGVIKITDDLICPYCNKRFVGTNAFAATPSGTAIHYVCFQNQQNQKNLMNGSNNNANNFQPGSYEY